MGRILICHSLLGGHKTTAFKTYWVFSHTLYPETAKNSFIQTIIHNDKSHYRLEWYEAETLQNH